MSALLENWRYRISFHWHCLDKGAVAFYALLPSPLVFFAVLAFFIHEDYRLWREDNHRTAAAVAATHEAATAGAVAATDEAAATRDAEIKCLAENVYHEARGEPLEGQYAVAEVTMNRVRSTRFPDSVCEVVHEKRWDVRRRRDVGAFSWTELDALRPPRGAAWQQALEVAAAVYDGEHKPRVPNALFYHANYIKPSWARTNRRVATIGSHVFYR
ncbi:MAG TPA: cell wall hydrolase [Gammaproteobacteria bacterium]|nr:cell wall hydrolase [Gammaproteobacteria bacterium]